MKKIKSVSNHWCTLAPLFDLKMKLTLTFFLIVFFQMQAETGYAQTTKISLDMKSASVFEIIEEIEATTEFRFFYRSEELNVDRKVDIQVDKERIESVLQKVFTGSNTNFKIIDRHIVLTQRKNNPLPTHQDKEKEDQETQISGTVSDKNGIPLLGVTIIVQGTRKGTTTDENGEYRIGADQGDVLVFSYIGFKTKEIAVGVENEINVTLEESATELGEVVIQSGYQAISSERVTGSYSTLDSEDFQTQRLNSLDAVLEGRVVGLRDGVVRGVTSMNGLTTPLFVIDGFPVEQTRYNANYGLEENLPNINIEDIESITVLKDAAATSIYGARAANGVVVILTKKAHAGETNVSFSSNLTLSPYKYYTGNLTGSEAIVGFERDWANGNPNLEGGGAASYASSLLDNAVYTSQGMQTLLNFYAGNSSESQMNNTLNRLAASGFRYYDDLDKYAKRDQYFQQFNIRFGKASEKNSFNASATYKDNKFEDIYSDEQSLGINLNNTAQITDWLTLDVGTYMFFNNGKEQTYNALNPQFVYQPYNGLVNADGSPFVSTAESRYSAFTLQSMDTYGLYSMDITPMEELGRNIRERKNFLNRSFAKLDVQISDAFSYNAMFQYEYGVDRSEQLRSSDSYAVRSLVNGLVTISPTNQAIFNLPYGDISDRSNQYSNAYNFRQQLNFDKLFNGGHHVSAIAGTEVRHSKLEYSEHIRYGYDSQTLSYTPINQADLLQVYGSVFGGYLSQNDFSAERELLNRYVSVYGNAGYTYDSRYSVTGSLRWDRSNLWGTDNKYQNKPTWSAGAGWNLHNESFLDKDWINRLKLRFSYGIGGNVAKNSAPYLTAGYSSNNNVGGIQGYVSSRPNPQLSWEKTTTTNVGVDFSFFKNRLNGTVDYYHKKGEDLLANSNGVPTEGWGYSTYTLNNGEMINRGVEITLNGSILRTEDFSWDIGVMFAHNKNEVTYVNVEAPVYFLQLDYPSEFPRVGTNYNSIYAYKWAGLSSTGLPQVYDAEQTPVSYNPGDLEAIEDYGTTVPIQSGSFNTSINYKDFSLSALFIYGMGHKIRNTFLPMFDNSYSGAAGGYITNIRPVNNRIEDSWRNPGDEARTDVPRVVYEYDPEYSYDLRSIYSYADINILDASHVRLSNVSLAYRMPSELVSKLGMKGLRMNFNVENVFTLAKSRDAKYLLGGYQTPNFVLGFNVNL
ncbi:SusC/RagA family TonB-linked outer membrane protein [Muricauda sp. TY007]|uniref:SusC/RagA family TonB-linked outer membrane protein n=1 Tax=Allomuricauda sp. TY007 TaxID=2683200 RepID=UPI0013BFBDE3|nr:SusC/RagA family TonB-linked outer membrane protein [Muricauda sp. TY007]NDV17488.1 SusC/RagA family TonB-linked outer membrane protein [Muricauda sp. TY007]